jgi:sugar (pentulose or hexulose) kinase
VTEEHVLAFDIGTTSIKVGLFRAEGPVVAMTTREQRLIFPSSGHAEQSPAETWTLLCDATREVTASVGTRNMIARGDTVAVENVMTATFVNDLRGVRATGRSFTTREAVFFEMEEGKIKAARIYQDQKSAEEQLGLT